MKRPPPHHRHFERSGAILSSAFAPAKASPCAVRNLSSFYLHYAARRLWRIARFRYFALYSFVPRTRTKDQQSGNIRA